MGLGSATGYQGVGSYAAKIGIGYAAVIAMWLLYTVALCVMVVMMIIAAACSPFVVAWCLLFDAD